MPPLEVFACDRAFEGTSAHNAAGINAGCYAAHITGACGGEVRHYIAVFDGAVNVAGNAAQVAVDFKVAVEGEIADAAHASELAEEAHVTARIAHGVRVGGTVDDYGVLILEAGDGLAVAVEDAVELVSATFGNGAQGICFGKDDVVHHLEVSVGVIEAGSPDEFRQTVDVVGALYLIGVLLGAVACEDYWHGLNRHKACYVAGDGGQCVAADGHVLGRLHVEVAFGKAEERLRRAQLPGDACSGRESRVALHVRARFVGAESHIHTTESLRQRLGGKVFQHRIGILGKYPFRGVG